MNRIEPSYHRHIVTLQVQLDTYGNDADLNYIHDALRSEFEKYRDGRGSFAAEVIGHHFVEAYKYAVLCALERHYRNIYSHGETVQTTPTGHTAKWVVEAAEHFKKISAILERGIAVLKITEGQEESLTPKGA